MGPRRHTTARPSGVRASGMSTEGSVRLRRERTAGLLPPTMPIPRAVWCGARSRNRCPHTRGAAHPARQPGRTGHRSARPVYREPGGPPAQVASSRRFRPRLRPCRTRWWTPARWPPRRLWRRRRHPSPFGATARSSSTLENRTATAARRHCRRLQKPDHRWLSTTVPACPPMSPGSRAESCWSPGSAVSEPGPSCRDGLIRASPVA